MDPARIVQRIDELLAVQLPTDTELNIYEAVLEQYQGTMTLVVALYGDKSRQCLTLIDGTTDANSYAGELLNSFPRVVSPVIRGTLRAMRADVKAGLVGNIAQRAFGEVLADMLGLAKEALAEAAAKGDGARNVAAVLTAATYEDTIRKMGDTLAGVVGRPDLADVFTQLKIAGVLVGASVSTANGYLKFRNDALHADWAKLTPAVIGSCIAFTEGLLLQHFS